MRAGARSACLGACRHRGFAPRLGCVESCAASYPVLVLRLRISALNRGVLNSALRARWSPGPTRRSAGASARVLCCIFTHRRWPSMPRRQRRHWRASGPCRAHALHLPTVHTRTSAGPGPGASCWPRASPPPPPLRAAAPGGAPCCEPNKPCCETAPRGDTPFPGARTPAPTAQTAVWAEPGRSGSHTARWLPGARHPVVVLHSATPIRYTLVSSCR